MDTFIPSETGSILASLVTVLTLVVVYYNVKIYTFWSSRGIKGPLPVPLFGTNIYFIFKDRSVVDFEWRQKYGHTYGTYEGYEPVLRTTDNEIVKHVWIKNFSSFTDRNNHTIHGENLKRWLFWSSGEHWNNQRVLISPMFTSARMKTMFNVMAGCMQRFKDEVERKLRSSVGLAGELDEIAQAKALAKSRQSPSTDISKDDFMALTLDVIAQGFFSLRFDTYQDKTSEFFKRAFAFSKFDVPYFIMWMFIPDPIRSYFKIDLVKYSHYEYFEKLSQKTIDERRRDPSKRQNDFVQALIEAKLPDNKTTDGDKSNNYNKEKLYDADDDKEAHYNDNTKFQELELLHEKQLRSVKFRSFDDKEIRAQMTFFFLAGFETTSSSLTFCFYELAHQQAAQSEVYQELISRGFSKDKQPDYSELLSLKKLDALVSECLRLYSPVTEHNRIVTNKDGVTLPTSPPIHLPSGIIISNPGFVYQRDQDYWEKPLQFDMARFYPENRHKIITSTYNPFGLGPRNCAGMRFALLTLKTSLATILLSYRILPGPKSSAYPPEFNRHAFFLQLKHTDFKLVPRQQPAELA